MSISASAVPYRVDAPSPALRFKENADGSISAVATVRRCGVYEYRQPGGKVVRELVLPEHTFDPASLATLGNVALTYTPPSGHPPEMINPDNAGRFTAGHIHSNVDAVEADDVQDFGFVQVRLTGRTRRAVDRLKEASSGGRPIYTSPGYRLPNYDATPGVHPVWGPYDAIQGPPIYNHVAMTDHPRGGNDMVVHMDGADVAVGERTDPAGVEEAQWSKAKTLAAAQGREQDYAYVMGIYKRLDSGAGHQQEVPVSTETVRLDAIGQKADGIPEGAARLIALEFERRDANYAEMEAKHKDMGEKYAKMKEDMERHKADMDKIKADMADMEKEKQDAAKRADAAESKLSDMSHLRSIVAPRLALEADARQHLAKDRHDGIAEMSDDALRLAVLQTVVPGKAEDFGRMDAALLPGAYLGVMTARQDSTAPVPPASRNAVEPNSLPSLGGDTSKQARVDADAAYNDVMAKRYQEVNR